MLEMIEHLTADAAKCAGAATWAIPDDELVTVLAAVQRLEQVVVAAKLHLVHEIDRRGLASVRHFRTTAGLVRASLRIDPAAARDLVRQAAALGEHPDIDAALCNGAIQARHVTAVTDALDALPAAKVGPDVMAAAETALLELAAEHSPAQLRRAGARILDRVSPDLAACVEEETLERQERLARTKRGFVLSPPVGGRVLVNGSLTVEDAAVVQAALDPLCAPAPDDTRTPPQQRADALVEVCRLALRTGQLPETGGEPPQLTVTVQFDPVARQLGTGVLDNGAKLSAAAVRRLACDAQVLPAVLGGAGQILDAGRSRRLAGGPVRRALTVRDRGCAFPACDRPPRWCEAHHVVPWSSGGPTNLANLVLLCAHHHGVIHDGGWTVRMGTDGLPEFVPPAHVDRTRRARRNRYHRPTPDSPPRRRPRRPRRPRRSRPR